MSHLIPPHGGTLVNRLIAGEAAAELEERVASLPAVRLSDRSVSDLEMIAIGGFSPLTGFMGSAEYRSVVREMHLVSGLPWSIPVTLAVTAEEARSLSEGGEVVLADESGQPLAVLTLVEAFSY